MDQVLNVKDLTISYALPKGEVFIAVKGASISIPAGSTLALVGESGSGKSTLAAAVNLLLPSNGSATSGEIALEGSAIHQLTEGKMREIRGGQIGLVPQDPMSNLNPMMTVGNQIAEALTAHGYTNHVIGLVPATDNRPGGNAVTPGDVITISDGTTVEVMNTDAEGRLILSDALVYAKRYNPELVIDLATLTGAAARAIGHYAIVGMGNFFSASAASDSASPMERFRSAHWRCSPLRVASSFRAARPLGGGTDEPPRAVFAPVPERRAALESAASLVLASRALVMMSSRL